jgi:hypothetical protein
MDKRTTINLDDEIIGLVPEYARSRSLSLEKAVSELVRRGFEAKRATRDVNGLLVFDLPGETLQK